MGKLPRLEDGVHPLVADGRPTAEQRFRRVQLAHLEAFAGFEIIPARQGAGHQGAGGCDNDGVVFRLFSKW